MYPLKFNNIYFEKIWGGRAFECFRDNVPDGNIGESWDVAYHPKGTSTIINGVFKGLRIDRLIQMKGKEVIGSKIPLDWFPLLVKTINANDRLSIQVHPDDQYAQKNEGGMGKNEAWYVMEASKEARLVLGMNGDFSKEQFKKAIELKILDKYINEVPVKKGDVFFVKSGLIHAIGKGVTLVEIQQNSDITFRVYDYDRERELHIEKALDTVNLSLECKKCNGIKIEKEGYQKTYLCLNESFALELYDIHEMVKEISDEERFCILTCVEGQGKIIYQEGIEKIKLGDSILIPAYLGAFVLAGRFKVLKSYVPDLGKVEEEILSEIRK